MSVVSQRAGPSDPSVGLSVAVLGELSARIDGRRLALGGRRQCAVLALLVLARGEPVSADRLIECLWGAVPPGNAMGALQALVSRLRARLQTHPGHESVIVSGPAGYALDLHGDAVDAWRFEQLVREAARLPNPRAAAAALSQALELWQGPALAEYADEPWAQPEAARLNELRELARERLLAARLALGEDAVLVPELEAMVAATPLREERWRLLVLALYRAHRQGDALAALRRVRGILAEQLGVDPGPALRALEAQVLAQAADLAPLSAPVGSLPPDGDSSVPSVAPVGRSHNGAGGPRGRGAFAELLRAARDAAALSQEELARRAGLTPNAVGALERGERRTPYPHTLRALADALGLAGDARAALTAAARAGSGSGDTSPSEQGPQPRAVVPAPGAPLLGRDGDRDKVLRLLRGGSRLVTLTGPGGVGKTSLALDVAGRLAAEFAGAVTVVELAPVREAALVLSTLAHALGIRQIEDDPLDRLATVLADRRHLVLLDNVEHLLEAAVDIAELLARCPGLLVLATSRAPLRVRAEQEVPLAPLAVPAAADVAEVAASPSALLFLDRARAAGRELTVTASTAADLAAICRRLDGLPLALELAATHARFLSPATLLARLDSAVSSPRSRDLPARQRTLRATLDWSHQLLTAEEQVLLRRLSVFVGGFTLEAVEAVADGLDAVAALAGLVEQSLVVAGDDRYRMLEPIRQYATGRLAESGEAETVADTAARFFCALAACARAGLRGADQARWLDLLQREHGNLGATFARLLATRRPGAAAQLGYDSWLYWALRGNAAEGLRWLDQLRLADGELEPADQVALELGTAGLCYATGDAARVAEQAVAAAAGALDTGDAARRAEALILAGAAATILGDVAAAEDHLLEARRLAQVTGDRWALAHAAAAEGQLRVQAGDPAAGGAVLAEGEAVARALGCPFTLALVLNAQAWRAVALGEVDTALRRLLESAGLAAEIRTPWTLAYALPWLGTLAARRHQPELAVELFAAAREAASVAATFSPHAQAAERSLAAVRAELPDDVFARAWERGRRRRPDEVPELVATINDARESG